MTHGQPTVTQPHHDAGTPGPRRVPTTTTTTLPGRATTTSALLSAPGGAPVISVLDPAAGSPGEGIEVAGTNFLSSNGQIVATFDGRVAPTRCPVQNTCTVTVPPPIGSPTVQVTITTPSGTSNAMTFTYS